MWEESICTHVFSPLHSSPQLHEGLWPQPGLPGAVVLPLLEWGLCGGHLSDLFWAAGAQPVFLRPPPATGLHTHLQTNTPPQAGALPHQDRGRHETTGRLLLWLMICVSLCPKCFKVSLSFLFSYCSDQSTQPQVSVKTFWFLNYLKLGLKILLCDLIAAQLWCKLVKSKSNQNHDTSILKIRSEANEHTDMQITRQKKALGSSHINCSEMTEMLRHQHVCVTINMSLLALQQTRSPFMVRPHSLLIHLCPSQFRAVPIINFILLQCSLLR